MRRILITLSGCAGLDSQSKAQELGEWEFGSLIGETPMVYAIRRDASMAQIRDIFGESDKSRVGSS